MFYNLRRKGLIYTGIFFTILTIINGIIVSVTGSNDILELTKAFFWNPFSIFGYITLSIGLILQIIKINKHKDVQKTKSQTKQYNSMEDFVKDKTNK